jgi:hypothetical protein
VQQVIFLIFLYSLFQNYPPIKNRHVPITKETKIHFPVAHITELKSFQFHQSRARPQVFLKNRTAKIIKYVPINIATKFEIPATQNCGHPILTVLFKIQIITFTLILPFFLWEGSSGTPVYSGLDFIFDFFLLI